MIYRTVTVTPKIISNIINVEADIIGNIEANAEWCTPIKINRIENIPYEGAYEFTPTQEAQTIEIAEKTASQNIIINPIPRNYGLITLSGYTIIVS